MSNLRVFNCLGKKLLNLILKMIFSEVKAKIHKSDFVINYGENLYFNSANLRLSRYKDKKRLLKYLLKSAKSKDLIIKLKLKIEEIDCKIELLFENSIYLNKVKLLIDYLKNHKISQEFFKLFLASKKFLAFLNISNVNQLENEQKFSILNQYLNDGIIKAKV